MPQFSIDDAKHLIGPVFLILSVLFAAIGATPGGFANLNPNQEGGSSLGRTWVSSITGAPAPNKVPVTVEQGERISMAYPGTHNLSHYTLGFIDHDKRLGYTSAHCVPGADEHTYTPGGVEVVNANNTAIGKAYPSQRYVEGGQHTVDDIAIIRFSDNATPGNNTYSGDDVVKLQPNNDVTMCRYGATTRKVMCTNTANPALSNGVVAVIADNETHGDSGSTLYIKGLGIVGLYAGTTNRQGQRVSLGPTLHNYDAAFL